MASDPSRTCIYHPPLVHDFQPGPSMAHLPTTADLAGQEYEEEHVERRDDSWARPPPGAPLQADKTTTMEIDVVMSPPQQTRPPQRGFSMEDLEVARALTGLRQGACVLQLIPTSRPLGSDLQAPTRAIRSPRPPWHFRLSFSADPNAYTNMVQPPQTKRVPTA